MKAAIQTVAVVLIVAAPALAKRMAPEKVPPVITENAIISVPHFAEGARTQNGGVLEAHDPETKELLWRIEVYKTPEDKSLEKDVQHVFIKSLSFDRSHKLIILSDEKGRIYVLNLETKKVTRIE
jgi:tricorn protease-like protein